MGIKTPKIIKEIIKGDEEDIVEEGEVKFKSYGYLMIRVNGILVIKHRYIWKKHYGKIPEGFELHHINGNKFDNTLENLELVTRKEHRQKHKKLNNSK